MKKKPLIDTNPYLKDPEKREVALIQSVCTSSAIEGVFCKGVDKRRTAGQKSVAKKRSSAA